MKIIYWLVFNFNESPIFNQRIWKIINNGFKKNNICTVNKGYYKTNIPENLINLITFSIGEIIR